MNNPNITPKTKAENWLKTCIKNGLAHSYDVKKNKWVKPYPEVTGYLLSYFSNLNENEIPINIIHCAEKLTSIQNKNGGFRSFGWRSRNYLFTFDTSQIMHGFASLYKSTNEKKYLHVAELCASFLIESQLSNGSFFPLFDSKHNFYYSDPSTYKIWGGPFCGINAKLAEGFLLLYEISSNSLYKNILIKMANFYNKKSTIVHTHPLAYHLEGQLALGLNDLVHSTLVKDVIPRIDETGFISYTQSTPYAYVSGTVQLGVLLTKFNFKNEAVKIRNYARKVQSFHNSGGLFQYAEKTGELNNTIHTEINSWGTKYFCELETLLKDIP